MSSHPADPANPDAGNPPSPPKGMPELLEAVVDASLVARYFEDLARCAEVGEVIPKRAARERACVERPWTLEEAKTAILAGEVRGVQIRYRYAGEEWWDTLIAQENGVRMVRVRRDGQSAE